MRWRLSLQWARTTGAPHSNASLLYYCKDNLAERWGTQVVHWKLIAIGHTVAIVTTWIVMSYTATRIPCRPSVNSTFVCRPVTAGSPDQFGETQRCNFSDGLCLAASV